MKEPSARPIAGSLSATLGYWSALAIVATFLIFTLCFVAIAASPPLFTWSTLEAYLQYARGSSQLFQNLARVSMLLFGPLYVVLLSSIYDLAGDRHRPLARVALCLGVGFAALTGANYFVQVSAVRLSVISGQTAGLEQVVQANPYSAMSAVNMLGWTLFLGLSSLFVAPVFSGKGLERVVRVAFLLNGIFCLLGGVAYALDIPALVFLTVNFGMGGAVLAAGAALAVMFRRRGRVPIPA